MLPFFISRCDAADPVLGPSVFSVLNSCGGGKPALWDRSRCSPVDGTAHVVLSSPSVSCGCQAALWGPLAPRGDVHRVLPYVLVSPLWSLSPLVMSSSRGSRRSLNEISRVRSSVRRKQLVLAGYGRSSTAADANFYIFRRRSRGARLEDTGSMGPFWRGEGCWCLIHGGGQIF